jgi:hypothetical protein
MEPERLLAEGLDELKTDLKGFVETRYELLRTELSASAKKVRAAGVSLAGAAVLGVLALILLGFCVSFAIGLAFGSFAGQVGLIWGFLITGGGAGLVAAIMAKAGISTLKAGDITPRRTLRVLERDQESLKKGVQGNGDEQSVRRTA